MDKKITIIENESFDVLDVIHIVDAVFINCIFGDIKNSYVENCKFVNCNFRIIYHLCVKQSIFKNCNIENGVISCSAFNDVKIHNSNFYNALIERNYFNDIESKNNKFFDLQCPEKGEFIGYKKLTDFYCNKYLCKLLIPEDAKRSSATTKKCRCSKAKVLEIVNIKTGENVHSVTHMIRTNSAKGICFDYKVNEFVYPDEWDEDRFNECSHGIHFFMDKQDALDY